MLLWQPQVQRLHRWLCRIIFVFIHSGTSFSININQRKNRIFLLIAILYHFYKFFNRQLIIFAQMAVSVLYSLFTLCKGKKHSARNYNKHHNSRCCHSCLNTAVFIRLWRSAVRCCGTACCRSRIYRGCTDSCKLTRRCSRFFRLWRFLNKDSLKIFEYTFDSSILLKKKQQKQNNK